jgi:error-prone DNA polymerase
MGFIELHAQSAFSFLEGADTPETLVAEAARLGMPALALVDRDGVYGAPRFYRAALAAGIKPLVGSEITLADGSRLPLLVEDQEGYQNLCRLITRGRLGAPKGRFVATLDEVAPYAAGLVALTGGAHGPLAAAVARGDEAAARSTLDRLVGIFGRSSCFVELQRHLDRQQERHLERLVALARRAHVGLVASTQPLFARPYGRAVADVFTCIRERTDLDHAGRRLARNDERRLRDGADMARRFADLPEAVHTTGELAMRLGFTLKDLGYRFPDYPLPPGETPLSHLRALVDRGVRARYGTGPLAARARRQVAHELDLIGRLDLAGYFLIVWDIVDHCRTHDILVQGRGSAANSAVCYVLGITAVDPVGMDLLFERFLSEARGEWPDIDLDLPSGDRREAAIQYVYRRYGRRGAGMTANVITYRGRSAAREVGKALGLPEEMRERLSKLVDAWGYQDPAESLIHRLADAGCDPDHPRIRKFAALWLAVQDLPRHLGQHSGGMVIAAGRLDDVVPLEPATMPGRVVIQWDKDDCAALGIVKVDLLGLGMMSVLQDSLGLVRETGDEVDLARLPPDDPAVYESLQQADTIGVFQVESRAQMATLPRIHPERFYDLVVQVAIIRPGPIVGDMVHPYIRRRRGREPVHYAHPSLEPILARTLGVPLFQEQLIRMAMVAAGFTATEAEELRRAFGFKRSEQRMVEIEAKLRDGLQRQGIEGRAADDIVHAITSFALYGFPECVAGETRVIDADTGRWVAIEDIVNGQVPVSATLACDGELRLQRRRILKATASGIRMVYRLRTALGRELMATPEHPVLTFDGWRGIGSLSPGDTIAVARSLQSMRGRRWPRSRLVVLAGLIAEGNLCHPTTFYFYTSDARYADEFIASVERFGNTRATLARHRNCFSIHVRRRAAQGPIGAVTWARELGLWGRGAREKRLPAEVFELVDRDIALLLARRWEGDGHLSVAGHAGYDTASRRLAEDVQHLLLRLGIVSRLYERQRPYRGRAVTGYTVTVTGWENLRAFAKRIARRFLADEKRQKAETLARDRRRSRRSLDLVPVGVAAWIARERRRCATTASPELSRLATSEVYWDRVVSVEPVGERATYDLEIEGDHNFLANDLVVHNSHASSFAMLAYASAYLKVRHPAAFYTALLNNQPMGFYHPATIVKDAERHGLVTLPIDITRSEWLCTLEEHDPRLAPTAASRVFNRDRRDGRWAVRLGLRYVKGLRERAGRAIVAARAERPFVSAHDVAHRAGLDRDELTQLASIGALAPLGGTRRAMLWTTAEPVVGDLFAEPAASGARAEIPDTAPREHPLREMTAIERVAADYAGMGLTVGRHPLAFIRRRLAAAGIVAAAELARLADGTPVRVAGSVIVRQRPGTAKGFVFLTLEDETGLANLIVTPPLFRRRRLVFVGEPYLCAEGILQTQDGVISIRVDDAHGIDVIRPAVPSHDFG